MSPEMVGVLGFVIFVGLLFVGLHVGLSGLIAAVITASILGGPAVIFNLLGVGTFSEITEFTFAVVPLFLLMGSITDFSGAMREVYGAAQTWLGRLPGGLAVASIAACTGFAAACGSSIATVTAIGKMTFPEMKKAGYSHQLSAGALTAGGGIGILIPPSVPLVLFGMLTGTSVGKLLLAGFIPGLAQATIFILAIIFMVKIRPNLAPPYMISYSWRQKLVSLREVWPVIILIVAVLGAIYSGVATPTEAAAFGGVGIIVVTLLKRRLSRDVLNKSIRDTVLTTASVYLLVVGAIIFTRSISLSRLPMVMSEFIANQNIPAVGIFAGVVLLYILLGMFMDGFSMMVVTLPTIFPLMLRLGYDPVWFGIITIVLIEVGCITPPFALNLFAMRAVAPEVSFQEAAKGIIPFFVADMVLIALFTAFPVIVLFLPRLAS